MKGLVGYWFYWTWRGCLLSLQQCSLPSKDCGNSGLFIALFPQPGCPLPGLCHPSALLALGTLSSQLVLNLGWISPFSGIPKRRILTRSFICNCTTQA